ncbi:hypothetical protein [Turicibacter sanguinis]|uniref:hypothetical protein n=1 Tax=Turicibacter sanguinis TaxID=154288 RepID=UPI0021D50C3C|nr:hypothetical protein [Turicibacter sanguinis]MCU7202486.1 hypothetical protein [Turicibacter sanguinis]
MAKAKKNYGLLEQHIIDLFEKEKYFVFNNIQYEVQLVGKPRPMSGECKTDVYVLGKNNENTIELKISVKDEETTEFQGNKLTADVVETYLGSNWSDILTKGILQIKQEFENRPLIYVTKHHPTLPNSITLGWKLEISTKKRNLCTEIPLNDQEIRDYVYKGTTQSEIKMNSSINGQTIINSGVANYIIKSTISKLNTTSDVISQLIDIDKFKIDPTYFIFTANNYRTVEDKSDGNRTLAVAIKWEFINHQLTPNFIYDQPLKFTGRDDMKPYLLDALKQLGKNHPSDMNLDLDVSAKANPLV